MPMHAIRKIDLVAVALVLVYFAVLPSIEQPLITTFFIFWIFAYACDAISTIRSRNISHETNGFFAVIARAIGPVPALAVHFAVEVTFIAFIPFVFLRMLSVEASAFMAMVTGLLHTYAAISNSRFRSTNRSIYFGLYRLHTLYIC